MPNDPGVSVRSLSLGLAATLLLAGPASAETIQRTVKANAKTTVGGIFVFNTGTCAGSVIPDAKVGEQPRNGVVVVQVLTTTLGKQDQCAGHKVTGPAFIYTPNKGFKGDDSFTIEYPFARAESRPATLMSRTYQLRVE
jgi:hypothetical protein